MEPKQPIPSRLLKPQVHKFAESVANALGYSPGTAFEALLAKVNGSLAYRPLFGTTESADSIHVASDGSFTIYMSGLTSAERDRFTIAHELGHYFLHFPLVQKLHPGASMVATRWVDETDTEQRRAEWEANWFAAAFLMPKESFAADAKECGNDIEFLAMKYGVSLHAAKIRLSTL